ncbi:MAG: beta-galactosidase [Clostridiales bacterium]|nr:beta-galactosidase [Clostridiales bacterium]
MDATRPVSLEKIYFGGDYCPDQWDDATIEEDMRLFKKAHINLVTLPVFSWAKLEPEEGRYDFGWLDKIMDKLAANGIGVNLATPTVAQPAWMSRKYPEVLPVDIAGRKRTHGMRVFFCYNSPKYLERARAIASAMAKRYASHPALKLWHVANEYGTYCYCPICRGKFIAWLKDRYGSIEKLNERWYTSFWGRTVFDWEEINLPDETNDDYRFNPTVQLDYMRFVTDSTAACFRNEYDAIREFSDKPIQTNMSGYIKKLDQFVMASRMDIVGWDNYPWPTHEMSFVAMKHDIMRGLKGGQSFLLAEQSPNQQNWQPYNVLKRPGEVRRLSWQAIAHGADSCLFFQMRQSRAGQEKFHGAVISHSGRDDTRVFRETARLGDELERLSPHVVGKRTRAQAAIVFDWNNWWALENSSGPNRDIDYLDGVHSYYKAFYERHIPVDFISENADLSCYKLVVMPYTYMFRPGLKEKTAAFVKGGGTLLAGALSGLVDENDHVLGEFPAGLRQVLGLRIEETDALKKDCFNGILMDGREFPCRLVCDIIIPETAETLGSFTKEFYAGSPAVTVNGFGQGKAYYIGSVPGTALVTAVLDRIGLAPVLPADDGLEVTRREDVGEETLFLINHGNVPLRAVLDNEYTDPLAGHKVSGEVEVAPNDVKVFIRRKQHDV